jgi:hypothetical protein
MTMKPNSRITCFAFFLALLLFSAQAWAAPSACHLRCQNPAFYYDQCVLPDDTWTTCEEYLNSGGGVAVSVQNEGLSDLCAEPTGESKARFDFLK